MKGNCNQQKRHGRSLHVRLFSLLLAAVTMIPSTAFAAPADGMADSDLYVGEPVVRIAWTPQAESVATGEQAH